MRKHHPKKFVVKSLVLTVGSTILPHLVNAAELNTIPAVDLGQLQRTIAKDISEKLKSPILTPQVATPLLQKATIKQGLGITFHLASIIIEGATIYPQSELQPLYQAYLGKEISLADLQKVVDAITAKYRGDGYILSKAIIPPQRIQKGVVTIRIVEGYIDQASVVGQETKASSLIQSYGDQIILQRPLKLSTLERYALLSNDIPGVRVKSVLKPSPTLPGASDINLLVTEATPYNLFASFDNRGTRYVGPNQFFLGGNLNSFALPGDKLSLTMAQASQARELQFFQLGYLTPIKSDGATFEVNILNAYNQPGYLLQRLDIVGRSQEINLKLNYPIIRSRKHNLTIATSFAQRNTYTDIIQNIFYRDRIRSATVEMNYSGTDDWRGANNLSVAFEQGLNILGSSSAGDRYLSRPRAIPNYTKLNLSATRLQGLYKNFSLLVGATGQYTRDPLYASEQFGFGGSAYGRAYDPYEISGDKGLAGKLELRFDQALNKTYLQAIQYYAFYDVGTVWNIDTTSQIARLSDASTGLGARFSVTKQTLASLEVAKPLIRPVASLIPNGLGPRIFFNIVWFK